MIRICKIFSKLSDEITFTLNLFKSIKNASTKLIKLTMNWRLTKFSLVITDVNLLWDSERQIFVRSPRTESTVFHWCSKTLKFRYSILVPASIIRCINIVSFCTRTESYEFLSYVSLLVQKLMYFCRLFIVYSHYRTRNSHMHTGADREYHVFVIFVVRYYKAMMNWKMFNQHILMWQLQSLVTNANNYGCCGLLMLKLSITFR